MKQSLTSLPPGVSQTGLEQSASENDNESLLDELGVLPAPPEPTEEPDPVLADRRHRPIIQDDVTTLLLNSMLDTVVESWQGVPTMRPILKRASSATPLVDEPLVLDEQLDVVPDTIASPVRGHKSKTDNRNRRSKEPSSTSLLGLKTRKKTSKNQVNRSVASMVEAESATSKMQRLSLDKKKRRPSKEKRLLRRVSDDASHRDDKPLMGDESGGEVTDNKDETKTSTPDLGGRTIGSSVDLSRAAMQSEEAPVLSIDSWRVHFPDETANIVLKNGSHYEGRISRKLMEGEGIFTWADGTQYHGEFVDGELTGVGRMTWPDMSRYEGEFVKGWRYGRGLYVSNYKKMAYVGNWVEGRKHGRGLIFYNEEGSDMYDGEWCNDQRQGYGLRIYPSGARYLGEWQQGLRDGVGTMVFANGDVFSGNWEKGFMNGYGEYIWEAYLYNTLAYFGDNIYIGWFADGKRVGKATYQLKGGQYIHGEWNTDVKEGTARVICGDGSVYIGNPMFEDDRPVARKIETKRTRSSKDQSVIKPSLPKNRPTTVQNPKTGKLEVHSLQHPETKIPSGLTTSSFNTSKPPPPKPSMILHGYYLPVYAPFQCIDLYHHLALLKELKHPVESTGCQTDDLSLADSSSIELGQALLEATSESKKVMEEAQDTINKKLKSKFKCLQNEKSTQTGESRIEVLDETSNKEEIVTLQKDISQPARSKIISKKPKQLKESQHNSVKTLPNVVKNKNKSLVVDPSKIKHQQRQQSFIENMRSDARWLFRPVVAYPGGITEEAYEERWLRRTLMTHLPAIRKAYDEYARLGYQGHEQPFLLRAMLWQFYRDCKVTSRVSLVELDQMMESNPHSRVASVHCPFETIRLWQFIYSMIDVAWKLYASQGLGHPGSKGVLGSAFNKLMYDDVLCRAPAGYTGSVLTLHRDLLPLAPVYLLYRSLGEPLSARRLLQETCCRTGFEPWTPRPRKVAHYPDFATDGVNAFVLGDLTFLPQKPPLSCVETASYEETTNTALTIFRNVGVDGLTNILVDLCPLIKQDGVIVNMDYEITFLEFYEVLIKCEARSHHREERRLVRLAALEKYRLEMDTKQSLEGEKEESPIALSTKVGRTKQKKGSKSKP